MKRIEKVLDVMIRILKLNQNNQADDRDYYLVTFFDNDYPSSLINYIYSLPIIYYRGKIELLESLSAIVITARPSYYAQKTINRIRQVTPVLGLKSGANSITKESTLCDIIYCNDISELRDSRQLLVFTCNYELDQELELQLLSVLLKYVVVVEGYLNSSSFKFISDCLDNQVIIKAVPTNMYSGRAKLPNKLIAQGITPLLLN